MDWIKADRDILEVINLITAGPLLFLVAVLGLRQLFLASKQIETAKETARITNQRESFKLAAEQSNVLVEKIFPLTFNFEIKIRSQPFYKNIQIVYVGKEDDINIKFIGKFSDPEKKEILDLFNQNDPIKIANALNGFAMYFTTGIASEEIAFDACGVGFCTAVDTIKPIILDIWHKGYFKNLKELYNLWQDKIQAMSLNEQKQKLDAELALKKIGSIKSLGVD